MLSNGTNKILTTGNLPGLKPKRNGHLTRVVPTGFFVLLILMQKSMLHTLLLGCSTGKAILEQPWISAPDADMIRTAIPQIQAVFWEQCLAIIKFRITGNRELTRLKIWIFNIPICR